MKKTPKQELMEIILELSPALLGEVLEVWRKDGLIELAGGELRATAKLKSISYEAV